MKLLIFLILTLNCLADTTYMENAQIGNVTPLDTKSILQLNSTTKGSNFAPTMTTAQKLLILPPIPNGMTVFDSTLNKFSRWNTVTASWGVLGGAAEQWTGSNLYEVDTLVWHTDNKIYRALSTHTSNATDFFADYRAGFWANMSDGTATEPVLNGAVNVRLNSLIFFPTEYRMITADLIFMRKSSTVADAYFRVTLTCIWNGTAWIKNESSKTYFPGTPDDITFTIATDAGNNSGLVLGYSTPTLAGTYDTAFSKVFLSIKGTI